MILAILVIAIGAWICVGLVQYGLSYLNSYRLLLRSKCFHGPRAFPFIGSAYLFSGTVSDFTRKIQEITIKCESPCRLWLGTQLYFLLREPEHIKLILFDPNALERGPFSEQMKVFFGNGLVTAPVSTWKLHRKALEPLFTTKVLESFVPIIAKNALAAVKKLEMEQLGREFDVQHYTSRFTFDNICETSMGISCDTTNNIDFPFFDSIERLLEIVPEIFVKPWMQYDFIFKHSSLGQTVCKHMEVIHDFTRKLVKSAKSEMDKESENQPKKNLARQLLTLAKDECKFTDMDIIDHVVTITSAGYETSGKLLAAAILMLGRYPNIQDKVYAEVREICGKCDGGDITLQSINQLQYMDRFIKETLRLFPPVPWLLRYLSKDINIGEYTLPGGSSVMINLIAVHRKEKYWSQPLEFNPDRFLPDHPLGPRHPCAYFPFSMGRRNCIGMKYAMISMKMLLATLVSRYIIKTSMVQEAADLQLLACITLNLKDPAMVSIERRVPESS